MVKLGRSNVITIVIQVLACWCLFKQAKGQSYTISGSPSYAVKGGSYRFTCDIAGNIPSGIKFFRGSLTVCTFILVGNNCLPSVTDNRYQCTCNSNRQQLYLNITDVTTADDAVWKCTDNQGGGSGNTLNLPVYFGPESVGLNPANIPPVIEGGDMTSVTCSATCKPTCIFTWSFGSSVVPSSGGILRLTDINRTQTGIYTCQAKHPVLSTKITTDLTVTVYYGPDPIQFKPDITSITVTEGDNPVITCSADCRPSCDIKWKAGNSEISSDGKLSLPNINRTQYGDYVCIVTTLQIPNSQKRKTLTVNVNYPPRIISLTSSAVGNIIDDKSSVTFTCSSDSRPDSTITWSTSGHTNIGSGTQYTIPVASSQHTDNYTCTANNNIGSPASKTIPVYVSCSPRLRDGLESEVTNRVGQTVTLEVNVLAYPEPTFIWKRSSTGEELYNVRMVKLSANNYVSTLQINLESSSFGVYYVSVKNNIGEKLFFIQVIDKVTDEIEFYIVVIGEGAFYIVVIDAATTVSPPVTECTTSIVVGCIMAFIFGVCFGILGILIYQKRLNLHCNQKKKNADTAAVTYDVVGAGDVNNYDGINMTESTDNQTSPVYINQTTNPHHPPASSRDDINQTASSVGSNPVNTYEQLTTAYTNENSYETL